MKLSFRTRLLLLMTGLLLLTVALFGSYTYSRLNQSADEMSLRVLKQTSSLVEQRVQALLQKAESQSRLLAATVRPSVNVGGLELVDTVNLPVLGTQLAELVRDNQEIGGVQVVLADSGRSVQASQDVSGGINVSIVEGQLGSRNLMRYRPFGDRLLLRETVPSPGLDPRNEASYRLGASAARTVWTGVTLLTEFPTGPTPGITCVTPVFAGDGRLRAVVTVSLTLADISRFLNTIKVGETGFAFLIEQANNGGVRLVADPQPQRLLVSDGESRRLATLAELNDEVISGMVGRLMSEPRLKEGDLLYVSYAARGQDYVGSFQRVSAERVPNLLLGATVPRGEFLPSPEEIFFFLATGAGLVFLAGALASYLISRRVTEPLQTLVTETERIKAMNYESAPMKGTGMREVDALSESLERLKTNLRSLEKLVPTEYARHLISSGQEARLGGERRHLTTFFGDIVGFTKLTGELTPEKLVEVLTAYLGVLSDEVQHFGGTLDKFNGDDVMAFWGAPTVTTDHARQAVRCALHTLSVLREKHPEFAARGLPALEASFGIATGDVIVGNVGNAQRMNYTVIGDSVNLASRLQGLNRFYGTHLLVSQATRDEVGSSFLMRPVDMVAVYGRPAPEIIFEPFGEIHQMDDLKKERAEKSERAFAHYLARRWTPAAAMYAELALTGDPVAELMRKRCVAYLASPPDPDWDGVTMIPLK